MSTGACFDGRLGIVQRVLARYRVPVFETLATRCSGGLSVYAGAEDPGELLDGGARLDVARLERGRNRRLLGGPLTMYWQDGLLDWLAARDPDVLVVEANPRLASTRRAVKWMHRRGRPVLGWGFGLITYRTELERLRRLRRRRFPRMFDGMIAYSSYAADGYRDLGFPPDRVFVCKNAVTFRPVAPPQRPAAFDGPPVIVSVGRLMEAKRLDDLLRACRTVAERRPDLAPDLRIVGEGEAGDRLRALAATVYPSCRFLGALYGADLAAQLDRADLFVLPGAVGLAVQEAMAHGLPVIVGEGDRTQDDLIDSRNGWHVPLADAETLAGTIEDALSDAGRLREMGAASLETVQSDVNIETLVDSFIGAVNGVRRS